MIERAKNWLKRNWILLPVEVFVLGFLGAFIAALSSSYLLAIALMVASIASMIVIVKFIPITIELGWYRAGIPDDKICQECGIFWSMNQTKCDERCSWRKYQLRNR